MKIMIKINRSHNNILNMITSILLNFYLAKLIILKVEQTPCMILNMI
jgi:hypothetical protein